MLPVPMVVPVGPDDQRYVLVAARAEHRAAVPVRRRRYVGALHNGVEMPRDLARLCERVGPVVHGIVVTVVVFLHIWHIPESWVVGRVGNDAIASQGCLCSSPLVLKVFRRLGSRAVQLFRG